MSAETITGNALHEINAAATGPAAANVVSFGLEVLAVTAIGVYIYNRFREALR